MQARRVGNVDNQSKCEIYNDFGHEFSSMDNFNLSTNKKIMPDVMGTDEWELYLNLPTFHGLRVVERMRIMESLQLLK